MMRYSEAVAAVRQAAPEASNDNEAPIASCVGVARNAHGDDDAARARTSRLSFALPAAAITQVSAGRVWTRAVALEPAMLLLATVSAAGLRDVHVICPVETFPWASCGV